MRPADGVLRDFLGAVAPLVCLGLAVGSIAWAWDRLPEPIATHWSLTGGPDGSMPRTVALILHAAMAGIAAIGAFAVSRRAPARRHQIAPPLALAVFFGVLAAALAIMIVALNLDAPSWQQARPIPFTWLAISVGGPCAAAAAVSRGAARLETVAEPPSGALRPSVGLGATERAVWTGSAGNPWFGAIALALLCTGLVELLLAPGWIATTCICVALVLATFAVVRVRVDGRGLTVAYGPLAFPRQRVPLSRIRDARAIQVQPMRHGGWGYRGSLLVFRRAAIVVRRGTGIQLDCGDRGTLVVTVDDAETGAGLLNDLVARARPSA